MPNKPSSILTSLLILLLVLQGISPLLSAQAAAPPTPEELDQLLAPVALYPDALLSQITTASTNPQEILDVHAWLESNSGLTGTALTDAAEKQGFDPAFIALVNFPSIVAMMADHIDDYAAIGQAFSADQEAVTASIQRLRAQAYDSGALRSNEQQQVHVQQSPSQTIYVIQPASPTVVYVPQYDPAVVYVRPAPGAVVTAPLVTFSVGIGIGALIVDNRPWGWGGGDGIGERGAPTTTMDIGAAGATLIVHRISGIVRDPSCGRTAPDIAGIGAIVHPTTGLRVSRGRDLDVRQILPVVLRLDDQFLRPNLERRVNL